MQARAYIIYGAKRVYACQSVVLGMGSEAKEYSKVREPIEANLSSSLNLLKPSELIKLTKPINGQIT